MPLPARISREVNYGKREPREGDSTKHTKWVKTLWCAVCGVQADDPHHLKAGVDNMPKGMSRKHPDRWTIPVCRTHHDWLEAGRDEEKLISIGIDGRALANALWRVSGDSDAAYRLLYRARTQRGGG